MKTVLMEATTMKLCLSICLSLLCLAIPAVAETSQPNDSAAAQAQQVTPDARNTFLIMALGEPMMRAQTTEAEIRHEMDRLIAQFGKGNRYHRIGFGFIYPGGKPEMLRRGKLYRQSADGISQPCRQ